MLKPPPPNSWVGKALSRQACSFVCSFPYPLQLLMLILPPPETGGLVFALSGSEQSLIRDDVSNAESGDSLITTGTNDLGSWTMPALTSPLEIENTSATLVLYAMPVGIVLGQGIIIDVSVLVDGEEVAYGSGDIVVLNEPLMTNVPWVSEPFNFIADVGQVVEVSVVANLDGFGAAQITWGQSDAPAVFGLSDWELNHSAIAEVSPLSADMAVSFTTPWNCTDIQSVSLSVHGPVDDHDAPWPESPTPGEVYVLGSECDWSGNITGLEGTLLYRWHVEMSDGEQFNLTGDIEVEHIDAQVVSTPKLSFIGAILGSALLLVPLLSTTTQERDFKAALQEGIEQAGEMQTSTIVPMASWLVVGLLTGLLAGPIVAVIMLLVLATLFWSTES